MSMPNGVAIAAVCCLALTSCGGGSSSTNPEPADTTLTGVFVDSPVEGATFSTETQAGITNSSGQFSYLAGEQVTFSIGALQLPTITAAAQVSPVDMAATSSDPTATTTNIARLLQSLDQDGNPDNGITIPAAAAASAASINFDVSTEDFANNAEVINLVANSGSVTTALISAEAANEHLNATLSDNVRPEITGSSLTQGTTPVLTVTFSIDMTADYKTEGEYIPARTFWQDPKTFIVEFESVQPGGSIRLIPEFFISVSGEMLEEGLEVTFANDGDGGSGNISQFNVNDLVAGSRWYSIRVYDGRSECGNSYSFSSDGSLSAGSNGQSITGTYSLSDAGLMTLDTDAFGVENWQLVSLNQAEWSSNKSNNNGDAYLERSFSSRSAAIDLGNSLGSNCDSAFP